MISNRLNKVAILMYHGIDNVKHDPWGIFVSTQNFEDQIKTLSTQYRVISLIDLISNNLQTAEPSVVITFDDGYANNLYNAVPVLEKYRVPATFFITTHYLGTEREYWWDEIENIFLNTPVLPSKLHLQTGEKLHEWDIEDSSSLGSVDKNVKPGCRDKVLKSVGKIMRFSNFKTNEEILSHLRTWANVGVSCRKTHRILTKNELLSIIDDALIDIGSHTVTHTVLSQLPENLQRQEIVSSKKYLEQLTGKEVSCFAYPNGKNNHFNNYSVSIVKEAGYMSACTTESGQNHTGATDKYRLPRFMVTDCDGEQILHNLQKWSKSR